MDEKYIALFVDEARELTAKMAEALGRLRSEGFDESAVQEFFRDVHTLKGMASAMGFDEMASLTHRLEDLFQKAKEERQQPSETILSAAYEAVDFIANSLDEVSQTGQPQTGAAALLEALEREASGAAPSVSEAEAVAGQEAPGEEPIPSPPAASAPDEGASEPTAAEGSRYRITFKVEPTDPLPAARAMVAYKGLEALSTAVLEASPSLDLVMAGKFSGEMTLHVASTHSRAAFESAFLGFSSIAEYRIEDEQLVVADVEAEEAPAREPAAKAETADATVRIPIKHLDYFFNCASEFIVHHGRLEAAAEAGSTTRVLGRLERLKSLIREFYEEIVALRMMPFETLVPRLERVVRDAARQCSKDVRLEIEGQDVALDRSVLDEILGPLTHVLRNAVDHGIDSAEERRAAKKPAQGMIRVALARRGDAVEITVQDDGGGMDPEKIKAAAVERGYMDAKRAAALSVEETLLLCTLPGFSIRSEISALSGRGVGLDAVRTKVETLGGHLHLASERGRGTTVRFVLPPTMSILSAFLVEVQGEAYAVPLHQVHRTIRVERSALQKAQSQTVFWWRRQPVEVHAFAQLLGISQDGALAKKEFPCLVVQRGKRLVALVVDSIEGTAEIVVKPLHTPLEELRQYSGCTVFGDGRLALIVDVENLLTHTQGAA
ncbi:MAG: chemotaxis protein CheA [Acidobacteriota bacterium]|nr:MAG: chemotaxis protein CheA [Acidobacteriota bacterium]